MDSFAPELISTKSPSLQSFNITALSLKDGNSQADLLVLEATFQDDRVKVGVDSPSKALSLTAQEIVDKLNELLKADLPDGLQSLKPQDVTPEATAERIVRGATAFFGVFAEQNPNLQGEELLSAFMETIRGGIDQGYSDAFETLKGLGAFEFEGVQDSVQQTKSLIESKLIGFEQLMREQMGLSENTSTSQEVATDTRKELLSHAGAGLLNVVA